MQHLEQSSMSSQIESTQFSPYHYSSHYSNSGVVLHFMVRVPPFTQFFLRYQGKTHCDSSKRQLILNTSRYR